MNVKAIGGIGLSIITLFVVGGILLYGQNAPTITSPTATPTVVVVNTLTPVTFTIDLSGTPSAIPTGVNLLRLSSGGAQTIVGTMNDTGKSGDVHAGDKVFTAVLNMTEAQPSAFSFQVSAAFPGQLKRVLSPVLQFAALAPTTIPVVLPPDPGEAGKATLAGIDSDGDGLRDDIFRSIVFVSPDSEREREALKSQAKAIQSSLVAQTIEESIQAGTSRMRSIECLNYLGKKGDNRWRTILSLMLNTADRIRADEADSHRTNGQVFTLLPYNQQRSACTFHVESLLN